jgi:hypothetical protein
MAEKKRVFEADLPPSPALKRGTRSTRPDQAEPVGTLRPVDRREQGQQREIVLRLIEWLKQG